MGRDEAEDVKNDLFYTGRCSPWHWKNSQILFTPRSLAFPLFFFFFFKFSREGASNSVGSLVSNRTATPKQAEEQKNYFLCQIAIFFIVKVFFFYTAELTKKIFLCQNRDFF